MRPDIKIKMMLDFPYSEYLLDNYNTKFLNNAINIYSNELSKSFYRACEVGNLLEILRILKYLSEYDINYGVLWICSKNYKNTELQKACLESVFKSNKLTKETIEKCKHLCVLYNNEYLIEIIQLHSKVNCKL